MGFFNRYREIPHRDSAVEHIAEDLRHYLNAQRGYGSPIREFGTSQADPHADAAGMARKLLGDLLATIQRYLPQLGSASLKTLSRSEDLVLHIELRARLAGSGQPVRFLLHYNQPYGGFDVEVSRAE